MREKDLGESVEREVGSGGVEREEALWAERAMRLAFVLCGSLLGQPQQSSNMAISVDQ